MKSLIQELINKNDLFYEGDKAYGNIETDNSLLRQMIKSYEYPAYSSEIISRQQSAQYAKKYWQRVPVLDKVEDVVYGD